jgi:large subunit ribosomal protein L2
MGKPLITQRRGKGSPSFTAPSHRFAANAVYRNYDEKEKDMIGAEVINFVDDPGRTGLLMFLKYEDGKKLMLPAAEGLMIGDNLEEGYNARLGIGNVLPLEKIPEGYPVFNIEQQQGDGGHMVRSSGGCSFVVSRENGKVMVKLPSGQMKYFDDRCRATIGCVAGGGRTEKPMLKAGASHYKRLARGHWFPMVRGNKMNACEHPFGGKQHHGAITPKGVGGSPGQHVGSFGSRRTGRRKR